MDSHNPSYLHHISQGLILICTSNDSQSIQSAIMSHISLELPQSSQVSKDQEIFIITQKHDM